MGCGLGKRKIAVEADFQMEDTGDSKYDPMFHELEPPLLKLQKSRKKLLTAFKTFQKEVGTYKQLKNPSFFDSLMAMLFCFSVSAQGNLESIGFSYTKELPYVRLNTNLLYLEHRRILPAWTALVTAAAKVPRKLAPLSEKIQTAIQETSPACENRLCSNHDRLVSNKAKLAQAVSLIDELSALARDINDTAAKGAEIIHDTRIAIVAIGQQAFVDQKLHPRDIVSSYWPSSWSPGLAQ